MLQGTLHEFSLDQIMNFLAVADKSGTLELTGDRGRASIQFVNGQVAGAAADATGPDAPIENAVLEMCRFSNADFRFVPGEGHDGEKTIAVAALLAKVQVGLEAWERMKAVVPSPDHMAYPVARLADDKVTVDKAAWEFLQILGPGASVRDLCATDTLTEFEATAAIKALHDLGLVVVIEPDPVPIESLFRLGPESRQQTAEPNPDTVAGAVAANLAGSTVYSDGAVYSDAAVYSDGSDDNVAAAANPEQAQSKPAAAMASDASGASAQAQAHPPSPSTMAAGSHAHAHAAPAPNQTPANPEDSSAYGAPTHRDYWEQAQAGGQVYADPNAGPWNQGHGLDPNWEQAEARSQGQTQNWNGEYGDGQPHGWDEAAPYGAPRRWGSDPSWNTDTHWVPPIPAYDAPQEPLEPNWGPGHPEAQAANVTKNRRTSDADCYPVPIAETGELASVAQATAMAPNAGTGKKKGASRRLNQFFGGNSSSGESR